MYDCIFSFFVRFFDIEIFLVDVLFVFFLCFIRKFFVCCGWELVFVGSGWIFFLFLFRWVRGEYIICSRGRLVLVFIYCMVYEFIGSFRGFN